MANYFPLGFLIMQHDFYLLVIELIKEINFISHLKSD